MKLFAFAGGRSKGTRMDRCRNTQHSMGCKACTSTRGRWRSGEQRKERKPEHQVCTTSIGRPFVRSRIHFQEYNVKSAPPFVRSQNTLPRMKHTSTMKEVQEYNIKRAPPLLPTIRQILEYTSPNTTFKHTSMLSSQNIEPRNHRRNPSITHPLCTYANFFSGSKIQLERSSAKHSKV